MSRHCLIVLLLMPCAALAPVAIPASEPGPDAPLSLDAAVEHALQTAPQLSAQTATVAAADSLTVSAGRLPDPQLLLGIENLPVNGSEAYSTTRDFMTMRKVGVMQTFPRAGKRRLERQRAASEATLARAELELMRLSIARDVATAWIRRASADAALADLRSLEPEARLQADAARAAVAAGRASTADAFAAETAAVQLANRMLVLESEARSAALELARWIDTDAQRPLAPIPALDELPAPAPALLAAAHEHASLLPFESLTEAARLDVALAKAERRPDWSAELAFGKRGPEFSDMVSLQFRIGLPLAARYRQDPVIAARRAQLQRVEADREAQLRLHTAELGQMIVQWELLGAQIAQYQNELLPLARDRTRAALAAYRAGRGALPAALDAFASEVDFVIERAQLQNERGRLWASLRYLTPQHLDR